MKELYEKYKGIIIPIILTISLLLFSGCKTHTIIQEVPVEVPVIHTQYVNNYDSIYIHDSIYHVVKYQNDTIYDTKTIYKYIYNNHNDTIVKHDSISKPVYITKTEIKEVEKKLNWLQQTLMYIGIGTIIIILIYLIYKKIHIKKFTLL